MPVLITTNSILNYEDIKINKIIKISFDNDKIFEEIKINENRKTFTNEDIDLTFIDINPNLDELYNFFNIDEYNDKNYKDEIIYVLQYPNGLKASSSVVILKNILNKDIQHYCGKIIN